VVSHFAGWSPRILRNNQDERGAMIQIDDDIRKLVTQIIAASRSRGGAKLNPKSVNIALAALRAYGRRCQSNRTDRNAGVSGRNAAEDAGLRLMIEMDTFGPPASVNGESQ
jgi:hypothetical protein